MIDWERLARAETHPLRVELLEEIAASPDPRSPNELSKVGDRKLNLVAYHVRALARAGLLEVVRVEPRRGAVEHFYATAGEGS